MMHQPNKAFQIIGGSGGIIMSGVYVSYGVYVQGVIVGGGGVIVHGVCTLG